MDQQRYDAVECPTPMQTGRERERDEGATAIRKARIGKWFTLPQIKTRAKLE